MDLQFVWASWPIKYLTKKKYTLSLKFEHETKAKHDMDHLGPVLDCQEF